MTKTGKGTFSGNDPEEGPQVRNRDTSHYTFTPVVYNGKDDETYVNRRALPGRMYEGDILLIDKNCCQPKPENDFLVSLVRSHGKLVDRGTWGNGYLKGISLQSTTNFNVGEVITFLLDHVKRLNGHNVVKQAYEYTAKNDIPFKR